MTGEALIAAAYAAFLLAFAGGLDLLARHSHRRSQRYRTAGFTYRHEHDLWICPEGQELRRYETDHERRLVRYRAKPHVCNACPAKEDCTESDEGREIAQAMDPWPHSEAGRFHRGLCVVIALLAIVVPAIAVARASEPADVVLLSAAIGLALLVAGRLASAFRRTPAGFPAPSGHPGSLAD